MKEEFNKIFGYKYFSSNNFLVSNSDGFEILIFDNIDSFNLVYRELDFDDNELVLRKYLVSKNCIDNILNILNNNIKIFDVPNDLNNGSCDGCGNEFYFSNGLKENKILAWNIDAYDISDKDFFIEQLDEYPENLVLKVFKSISKELKKEKFNLSLFEFSTKEKAQFIA